MEDSFLNGFQDKTLTCQECGNEFLFSQGEQAFYANKGLSSPKRCSPCRKRRKATITPGPERGEANSLQGLS